MQVAAHFCICCGCRSADPQCCRVTDAEEIHKVLRSRCTQTAFHYRCGPRRSESRHSVT